MAVSSRAGIFVGIVGMGVLAGCQEGAQLPFATRGNATVETPAPNAAPAIVEKDVEAPDVFAVNETGLWDGRPSLGGVWVAHPEVADPERVIIRNEANGKFVIGALFRRERDNPGPRIQVSSDAAAELGLLAGQPSNLDVVALRREEVQVAVNTDMDAPPLAEDDTPIVSSEEPTEAEVPVATASLDAEPLAPDADESAGIEMAVEPEKARKPGLFATLFGNRRNRAPAAEASEVASDIETASLDPIETAALAIDAAEAEQGTTSRPAAAAAAPAGLVPAANTVPSADLNQAYVQIGIFSLEKNARDTADSLRSAGLVPTVRAQEARGKEFWRVVVGPATETSERAEVLAKVRDLGYDDAYYVAN